jgi:eukaryotic-like serine/threonine-protein kinase
MRVVANIEYDRGQAIGGIGTGQGHNSRVFKCVDGQIGCDLVVKEIDKSTLASPAQFFDEAKAMNAAKHANVVPIRFACQTSTTICFAMDFYEGGSLADKLANNPLPLTEVLNYGSAILSGLGALHIGGHLHFDLKPSNVLFDRNGVPSISDFGQSRALVAGGKAPVPQLMYLPVLTPELISTGNGVIQTDVYQAGLTLYRAVNGNDFYDRQLPSQADLVSAVVNGRFPDRGKFLPHVPAGIRRVIRKALQIDPKDRYASAREMAKSLGRIALTWSWVTSLSPNGDIEWQGTRKGKADLFVSLRKNGNHWKCEIHKTSGRTRKSAHSVLWSSSTTLKKALLHLEGVFKALE